MGPRLAKDSKLFTIAPEPTNQPPKDASLSWLGMTSLRKNSYATGTVKELIEGFGADSRRLSAAEFVMEQLKVKDLDLVCIGSRVRIASVDSKTGR